MIRNKEILESVTYRLNHGFIGTVVNEACHILIGGSLKVTSTVYRGSVLKNFRMFLFQN